MAFPLKKCQSGWGGGHRGEKGGVGLLFTRGCQEYVQKRGCNTQKNRGGGVEMSEGGGWADFLLPF